MAFFGVCALETAQSAINMPPSQTQIEVVFTRFPEAWSDGCAQSFNLENH
jgi:hypothetical protein